MEKEQSRKPMGLAGRKFTAKVLTSKPEEAPKQEAPKQTMVDYTVLMERAFGDQLKRHMDKPPVPENPSEYVVDTDREEGNTTPMK